MDELKPFTLEKLQQEKELLAAKNAEDRNKYISDCVVAIYNNISYDLIREPSERASSMLIHHNNYAEMKEVQQEVFSHIVRLFPSCSVENNGDRFYVTLNHQ